MLNKNYWIWKKKMQDGEGRKKMSVSLAMFFSTILSGEQLIKNYILKVCMYMYIVRICEIIGISV